MSLPKLSCGAHAQRAAIIASLLLASCKSDEAVDDTSGGANKVQSAMDWTMLGYDLGSTYWNKAETKISTTSARNLTKAWDIDTQGGVTGSPLIVAGRVYLSANADQDPATDIGGLYAVDLASGSQLWRNVDVGGPSSPAFDEGILYVYDGAGIVRALDANDRGRQKWEYKSDDHPAAGGFSSPVVTKDYVLVGGSGLEEVTKPDGGWTFRGFVLALNKKDGSLAWKKYTVEPPSNGVGIWSTLSVDEASGVVVAGTGNNYTGPASDTSDAFLALPLKSGGDFLWKPQIFKGDVYVSGQSNGNPDGDFGANPILYEVDGRKLAAGGAKMGDVWIIDRADGSIVKQRNIGPSSAFRGGIFNNGAWDGKSLLFVCNGATSSGPGSEPGGPATLFALDPLTLDVKWERQVGGIVYSPITVANGVGFFGKDKTLQAFDTATGEVLKEFETEATIASAPAVSDGYVIFGSGMPWILTTPGTKYYALKVP